MRQTKYHQRNPINKKESYMHTFFSKTDMKIMLRVSLDHKSAVPSQRNSIFDAKSNKEKVKHWSRNNLAIYKEQ